MISKGKERVKIFVDWGDQKEHTYLRGNEDTVHKAENLDFTNAEIYMEDGFPRVKTVAKPLSQGCTIYVASGREVAKVRGKRKKSDKNDVFYIRELYRKKPNVFTELSERTEKWIELRIRAKKYNKLTVYAQKLKDTRSDLRKEYGIDIFGEEINFLTKRKRKIKRRVNGILPESYKAFMESIDGIGEGTILKIISQTNPAKYDSLSGFLYDNGYTERTHRPKPFDKKLWARTKRIRSIMRQAVRNIIRDTDERYYTLYKKFKRQGLNHAEACNRVATFLMKELYAKVKGKRKEDWTLTNDVI